MRPTSLLPLLALLAAGCRTAPVQISSPASYIAQKQPGTIWIQRQNSSFVLETPRIVGDSLLGYTPDTREEYVLALAELQNDQVRVRKIDKGKTTLLVGGISLAMGAMIVATAGQGHGSVAEQPACSPFKKTCFTPALRLAFPLRF